MKKFPILLILILTSSIPLFLFAQLIFKNPEKRAEKETPVTVKEGIRTKVKYPEDFTIVLVGDSMTERLGNSDELRANLKKYYPDKSFEILNYGFGSTNILSVEKRLTEKTFYQREFRPILDIAFDLIILESFGNNPLSELPLEQGLKKQTDTLDRIVELIKKENPRSKIVFLATIAPNKFQFGKGILELSDQDRIRWVAERVAYTKNHIKYAQNKNIPLINVYEKSLTEDGDGQELYLSRDDFIHPSPNGVLFISEQIADYLHEAKIPDQ